MMETPSTHRHGRSCHRSRRADRDEHDEPRSGRPRGRGSRSRDRRRRVGRSCGVSWLQRAPSATRRNAPSATTRRSHSSALRAVKPISRSVVVVRASPSLSSCSIRRTIEGAPTLVSTLDRHRSPAGVRSIERIVIDVDQSLRHARTCSSGQRRCTAGSSGSINGDLRSRCWGQFRSSNIVPVGNPTTASPSRSPCPMTGGLGGPLGPTPMS